MLLLRAGGCLWGVQAFINTLKGVIITHFNYELRSDNNEKLLKIFHDKCREYGIAHNNDEIFKYLHTYEEPVCFQQLTLFEK